MRIKCPMCDSSTGIREAVYGLPELPLDESKYYIAGCTSDGPEFICSVCGWGKEDIGSLTDPSTEIFER